MRTFKPSLSGKGLLAASVALVSGQALAETAGRVSFVSGEVTASQADGNSRLLQRGDAINAGDKISTRAGRLQVRFTDGGFVSLQPNSVFAVDEYLYTNRKPEETSLFFSLLQGGMRTITGTIGKVNKKSYQVRTPVATIGIRGTEYLASLGPDGLVVSVGQGFVNVENGMGSITAGARQNVAVRDTGSAPSLSEEKADVQASGVTGDREQEKEERRERRREALADQMDGTLRDRIVGVSDARDESGAYVFLFQNDGFSNGNGYSVAFVAPGSGPDTVAGYDSSATGDGSDDTLHVLFDGRGMEQAYQYTENLVFDRGDAISSPGNAVGNLKWGVWGYNDDPLLDGTAVVVNGQSASLAPDEYVHYIIGRMTPTDAFIPLVGRTATYSLQGKSVATGSDGRLGTLGKDSYLSVQFGTAPQVSASLDVNMLSGSSYRLSGTTSANLSVFASAPASSSGMATFAMSSMSCSYMSAGSGGCGGSMAGLFAGTAAEQIGLAYQVDDFGTGETVTGTGAFGRSSIHLTPLN